MSLLTLTNISKAYRKTPAVSTIELDLAAGVVGLLGPNGAGKTSLLQMITGFLRPDSGSISIAGHDIATDRGLLAARRQLGYVPQHPQFFIQWTVKAFLLHLAQLRDLGDKAACLARAEECLGLVGLIEKRDAKIRTLSGGMLQRLAIAQALLNDPTVLILDEPTAGLDPEERLRFRHLITQIAAERLILFSTHIVEDIEQTCNDVIILQQTIRYHGSIQALIAKTLAAGAVWDCQHTEPLTIDHRRIISSMPQAEATLSRIIGPPPANVQATPATSLGLNEAFAWVLNPEPALQERSYGSH